MRPSLRGALLLSLVLSTGISACRGRPATPPYAESQAPAAAVLLELTRPRLRALQVPKAKIREGRSLSGTLMLAAQDAPARFAGSITAAGNELVSIAVNEHEYALRWLRDEGLRAGFYSGPPSPCAIERVLGAALSTEDLVALLLGGGPRIANAKIVEQRWEGARLRRNQTGHPGHEVLTLQSDRERQELRFVWREGQWWFAGTSMWRVNGDETSWLWTVDHEQMRRFGDHMLPTTTTIRRPGRRGEAAVTISYAEQRPNPPALLGSDATADEGSDTWEDDWEDDSDAEAGGDVGAAPGDAAPEPTAEVPAVFRLDAAGLNQRGDLCQPK